MDGWHHGLNGHGFEQTLGDSEGQGNLAWGHKESDTAERLDNTFSKPVPWNAASEKPSVETNFILMSASSLFLLPRSLAHVLTQDLSGQGPYKV